MAHPAILRNLVEQYEALHVLHAEQGSLETQRRLEDVTYTLCVSTGTQTVEAALVAAEQQLTEALAPVLSLRGGGVHSIRR
jgi:hypothetical protein